MLQSCTCNPHNCAGVEVADGARVNSRQSILESVNGDQDRAIEALLGMSDPDYVSSETPRRHQVRLHCHSNIIRCSTSYSQKQV